MDAEISGEDDAIDELEGARLLARGVEIKLRDGPHRLILDYEALEFIEEEFDGIDGFMAALNETRLKQKRLRSIRLGLTAGLLHEKPIDQSPETFTLSVRQRLEARDLVNYLDALTVAIMEAFPPPTEADKTAPKAKGSSVGASPGNGSTTSQLSGSGARKRSSGA